MSQYVIEFGAERVQAIADAISSCLHPPINVSVDKVGHECHYVETKRPLAEVIADLDAGVVASAVIRCTDQRIRYALISTPLFSKSGLSKWMGIRLVSAGLIRPQKRRF